MLKSLATSKGIDLSQIVSKFLKSYFYAPQFKKNVDPGGVSKSNAYIFEKEVIIWSIY